MENNWYRPYTEPQPQPPVPKKRRGMKTTMITLSVLVLIAASCLVFRDKREGENGSAAGFSFHFGPGEEGGYQFSFDRPDGMDEDGFYENYEDYFENYYTGYEAAEVCDIPRHTAPAGTVLELKEAEEGKLGLQELYERCAPSIVGISAYPQADNDDYYSWGTGVIFSSDGYIITNSHIIEGCCRAKIVLYDDREFWAELVGNDSRSDIAVLKIDADGLTAAEFALSDQLRVGDEVAAIGNPLGEEFRSTFTNGIISGIDRGISYNGTTLTLIQTNAAINEGNSGGALVNMAGQVIGITNMKMSSSYAGSVTIEGVGFAIPSITAKRMADGILKDGRVLGRPALGLTVGAIPADAAQHYTLPEGLYVSAVSEGSDCAAQGIRVGDVVTRVNGNPARTTEDVTGVIAELGVGDTLTLSLFRDGSEFDVTVKLVDVTDVY
ncbi:MAG: PDZ domain-containing protein [Ruminococcaceae bacterium]|nr:PDZ domain-containing protein [Oscillospiraceae bacterium]